MKNISYEQREKEITNYVNARTLPEARFVSSLVHLKCQSNCNRVYTEIIDVRILWFILLMWKIYSLGSENQG